jgi:hypothetical protein
MRTEVRVLALAATLVVSAFDTSCYLGCDLRGVLRAADGREGLECDVRWRVPGPGSEGQVLCYETGSGIRVEPTVRTGRPFVCHLGSGDPLFVEVRVSCEGYQPLVTEPFDVADGSSCRDRDVGAVTVQPATP